MESRTVHYLHYLQYVQHSCTVVNFLFECGKNWKRVKEHVNWNYHVTTGYQVG